MTNAGEARIAAAFAGRRGRAALMPYLMGGYPDADAARRVGEACCDGGADLIELGFPFSDPLADGPVIHAAGTVALDSGATVHAVLQLGAALAERVPVVAMTYANLVLARGVERFTADLAEAGISGLIVPDVPYDEGDELLAACDAAGIALVPLVAPTTPEDRLTSIGGRARGFLYTVSVSGTTGERADVDATEIIARAKAHTDVPVALGFGISTPKHAAAAAAAGADGVIVGSRLVRAAGEEGPEEVLRLVTALAVALNE